MAKAFQDVQRLDSEENDHQLSRSEGPGTHGHNHRREDAFWQGPQERVCAQRLLVLLLVAICVIGFQRTLPPQPLPLQRLCSRLRLSLLVLGFNVLLLVAICVIGSQRAQLQVEFWKLKEDFSNFSSSTLMEIWTLSSHGGSAGDKVTSLESKLEKQQWDLKADHATLLFHLKHFPVDLRILACQMAFLRSNGTECCPINWLEHDGSCYWFSHSGLTWPEAEKYCQLENAHLVVINSREEQKFIGQHMGHFRIWIGLTESDGSWKWVDGTDYRSSYKNWAATQPDNWQGHEEGGSEDCVEVQVDGRWNDNFCKQVQRWACEMRQNITS